MIFNFIKELLTSFAKQFMEFHANTSCILHSCYGCYLAIVGNYMHGIQSNFFDITLLTFNITPIPYYGIAIEVLWNSPKLEGGKYVL